jgi:hypothetical protein
MFGLRAANPSDGDLMKPVKFEDDGRTFTCEAATSPATPGMAWWWISITGESQRYAAFATQPGDNERNLRPRVLAYYAQLLEIRARPREIRTGWGRGRPPGKKEEPGNAEASE